MPPQETPSATAATASATAAGAPAGAAAHGDDDAATMPVPALASLSLEEGSSSDEADSGSGRQQQQLQRPRRRPPTTSTTHRTVPLAQAIRPPSAHAVPSLVELSLTAIANNCEALVDIQGLDEGLAVRLLGQILQRSKLDYRLCKVCVCMGANHPSNYPTPQQKPKQTTSHLTTQPPLQKTKSNQHRFSWSRATPSWRRRWQA